LAIKTEKQPVAKVANYFGIEDQHYTAQESSQVVILPCAYEGDARGTRLGPKSIYEASLQIERFDDELWTEPYKIGICSHKELKPSPAPDIDSSPLQELTEALKPLVEIGKFPIVIGGDRALTIGTVPAYVEKYPNLSVLQVDAQATCHKTRAGNQFHHSCTAFQLYNNILEKPLITQVGVRNISAEEAAWMEENKPQINIFWARQQDRWNFNDIVATLTDDVYLTIDLDALDSGIMPSTPSTEPGGIGWYHLTELIKVLCVKKNVVGADIVGLAPIKTLQAPDILAAKLLYKLIGYRFALDLGVTKKYL
jgi:agmatinase